MTKPTKHHHYPILMATTIARTTEAFLLPHAQYFRKCGHPIDLLTSEANPSSPVYDTFNSVHTISWKRNPLSAKNIQAVKHAVKLIQSQNYKLISTYTPVASFILRAALQFIPATQRPKLVYTPFGFHFHPEGSSTKNTLFCALEKLASRQTSALVTHNTHDYNKATQLKLGPINNIYHLPGIGITLEKYNAEKVKNTEIARARDQIGIPKNAKYFLCIASCDPDKRIEDTIHAISLINNPLIHLIIAGTGPRLPYLQKIVNKLNLTNQVHFAGFRNDISELLKGAESLVLPSIREGLPRSILEAMAIETPVIAANIRGSQDLLDNDRGLLYPPKKRKALAKCMQQILDKPHLKAELTRNAKYSIKRYEMHSIIHRYQKIFDDLVLNEE